MSLDPAAGIILLNLDAVRAGVAFFCFIITLIGLLTAHDQ